MKGYWVEHSEEWNRSGSEGHKTQWCPLTLFCFFIRCHTFFPYFASPLLSFLWHESDFNPESILNVSCVTMTAVKQSVYKWSPFQMNVETQASEGRFWSTACRGTSIIDITANFGDILSKTCPAVCERNTWTQCFHVIFLFFFFYSTLFNSLQKQTVISNMCFFNALCVKRIDCDCADKWCFQMYVRLVEHKFSELNLCLLWAGSDGPVSIN